MDKFNVIFSQYCITTGILAVVLFMYGFFPIKTSTNLYSSKSDLPTNLQDIKFRTEKLYNSSVGKTVLMVIDGMRTDFITPGNMPYTERLLSPREGNKSCLLIARVHAPTVTMPRIKAMVTGTVSSYIDVVLNIGAPELTLDNIIAQASQTKKMIFYGDDTWLKLFPHQFTRSEGTSSFFVNDYTEVDTNVTRNLNNELQRDDWDVMVLHYLGLDHIGHIEGPNSSLINPKLREMDDIIFKLHTYLKAKPEGILVVTGDHGMKDSGSHGGVSLPEIIVPLDVFELSCPGYHKHEVLQVDIAATLSVLWGLPIPSDNIGVAIGGLLSHLTPAQLLYARLYNGQQLAANFLRNGGHPQHEGYILYEAARQSHYEWLENGSSESHLPVDTMYRTSLMSMSRFLSETFANYHIFALLFAIVLVLQVSYPLLLEITGLVNQDRPSLHQLLLIVVLASLLPLANPGLPTSLWFITALLLSINTILVYNLLRTINRMKVTLSMFIIPTKDLVLIVGTLLFYLSLFSTSLIEEEHQLWYFLWATIVTLHLPENHSIVLVLVAHRFLKGLNHTGESLASSADIGNWLSDNKPTLSILCLFGLLCTAWCSATVTHYRISKVLCFCTALCIYLTKVATEQVVAFIPEASLYLSSNGVTEAQLCWILLLLLGLLERSAGSLLAGWLLYGCLLLRPYNTILPPSMFIIAKVFDYHHSSYKTLLHYWLGLVFFFYQGNSNSLANVDIGAGYVGLADYNTVLVGIQLLCHTYSMPVLAYLINIHDLITTAKDWKKDVANSGRVYVLAHLLHVLVSLLVITGLRYHLFVWSVFSPKLLYVAAQTTVIFILVSVTNLILVFFT